VAFKAMIHNIVGNFYDNRAVRTNWMRSREIKMNDKARRIGTFSVGEGNMKSKWAASALPMAFLLAALVLIAAAPVSAQNTKPDGSKNAANANPNPGANSYAAAKDVEVATFYIHKGDPDAAIGRLEDAIKQKPSYGKPRLMLAEIYEKKNDKRDAVRYYQEYLSVFPAAPDKKKVEKKIEKLNGEIANE
jgi:tetratricopeptide (TPR) repeat protein